MAATNPNSNFTVNTATTEELISGLESMQISSPNEEAPKPSSSGPSSGEKKDVFNLSAVAMLPQFAAVRETYGTYFGARIRAQEILLERFQTDGHWYDVHDDEEIILFRARSLHTDMVVGVVLVELSKCE